MIVSTASGTAQSAGEEHQYLGQQPPGLEPQKFAPGFISLPEEYEYGSVFNREATEFYYGVDLGNRVEIRYSAWDGKKWSTPRTILPNQNYGMNDPFLSPDEQRLYFISPKALKGEGTKEDYDIWYLERRGSTWSKPINAGLNINTGSNEYYISFTREGTMYFSSNRSVPEKSGRDFDIYSSAYVDGKFREAKRLGEAINTPNYEADVFVAPDESYLIFCATRPDGFGRGDLYISFKASDGNWTPSVNMGDVINSESHELCPFVTHDGKYLFYTSDQDIYWVSTEIFEGMRKGR
ncbi:hypothetical protein E1J53_0003600 [Lewinella sp. W8]|nr:hypothetical protein [Lewinella sp. W8]